MIDAAVAFVAANWPTILIGLAVYAALVIGVVSTLLIVPPHYAHRKPEQGLALKGNPLDSCWGPKINNPKDDFGLHYEEIEFESLEDSPVKLRGWYIPGNKAASKTGRKVGVVTVHGGGRDRREFHRHMPFLQKSGYDVLMFDYREHGISDGSGKGLSWGKHESKDLLGAVRFAKEQLHWTHVFTLGTSNGATFGILAAGTETNQDITGVIAESAFATPREAFVDVVDGFLMALPFGLKYLLLLHFFRHPIAWLTETRIGGIPLRAIDVVDKVAPRGILFIHGTNDRTIHMRNSEKLFAKAKEPKFLWIAEDGWHTETFDKYPDEYEKRCVAFIEEMCDRKA